MKALAALPAFGKMEGRGWLRLFHATFTVVAQQAGLKTEGATQWRIM